MRQAQIIWYVILTLCLIPVLLWFMAPSFLPRFSGSTARMLSDIAQIFGLVGMSLFAMNLILSARLPFLIRWFHGLHLLYNRHGKMGRYGFYLILLHPVLLVPQRAGFELGDITEFFFSVDNAPLLWGKLALLTFTILGVLTIYFRPKYHIWKRTHQFMGLGFFFATLHIYFVPSDVSSYAPLQWYMLTLSTAALSAYLYHTILGRWLIKRTRYVVTAVENLHDMVTQITMKPVHEAIGYTSGQFVFASFRDPVVSSEVHPFTISAPSNSGEISISAKRSGDFTATLPQLSVGSQVLLEGPFGEFTQDQAESSRQVWIAGGIGITPFLSMAKSLQAGHKVDVDLFYCTKNPGEAVFHRDLEAVAQKFPEKFRLHSWCSDTESYLTAEAVQQRVKDLNEADIFICAPPPMIRSLRKQFRALGVSNARIHSEEFSY